MRYRFSSFLLSGVMLFAALGLMWLGQTVASHTQETLVVRNINVAVTPPPPPPPTHSSQRSEATLDMQVEGKSAAIQVSHFEVSSTLEMDMPEMPMVDTAEVHWTLPSVDISAFGLSELDTTPTLLTPVKVHFPKRLKQQGVSKVLVKLDVLIDEQGHVELMDIVENPHHELNKEIIRFVKNSRFTSPSKEDAAVKTRFIWPVLIEA